MITMAPELPGAMETIQRLTAQGIIVGIGHTVATYEQTVAAVQAGAKMVTHMFNAINSLHHRDPGPFGVIIATKDIRSLTQLSTFERPYFGIICDGIHLHPASINLAYSAHPRGFILVSDATMFMGMQDGIYDGNNGQRVEKRGDRLTLQGTDIIAGW
jgi:N-acetylglucosamine-6-phosphate deacetylase